MRENLELYCYIVAVMVHRPIPVLGKAKKWIGIRFQSAAGIACYLLTHRGKCGIIVQIMP